jgi:integrase
MPRTKAGTPPSYRRHASGQARVTVRDPSAPRGRRDILLGPYGSPESKAEYRRILAELDANNGTAAPKDGPAASDLTVNELLDGYYWPFAEQHYGTDPRGELANMRDAVRSLRELYEHTPAKDFDSVALEALQQHLAKGGHLSRTTVNARINRIRRIFKWAVRKKLVPASVIQELQAVPGLQRGRCEAPEAQGVLPVPIDRVEKTLPHMSRPVAAMVRLQLLSGCRAGEVVRMRGVDLVMQGDLWKYRPAKHKLRWRGLDRVVDLGPRAQAIVREYLRPNLEEYLFSPRVAAEEHHAERAARRKTKRTPSELARRRKRSPKRQAGERYTVGSYAQAIRRACERAFPPPEPLCRGDHETKAQWQARLAPGQKEEMKAWQEAHCWHPLQLRHTRADEVRALFGIEGSMAHLGHKRVETTQIYSEKNEQLAERIAREIG